MIACSFIVPPPLPPGKRIIISQPLCHQKIKIKKNYAISPKLYWSYNWHQLRDSVSPVCGIFQDTLCLSKFRNNGQQRILSNHIIFLRLMQNKGKLIPTLRITWRHNNINVSNFSNQSLFTEEEKNIIVWQ